MFLKFYEESDKEIEEENEEEKEKPFSPPCLS